ncbi:angiotensin-converting enzyme-like [Littorina saxatilis]|uniref:Angiotensin-converting enzyme n=1 Tax=Littorina saxatilis TaxID=31220 RepID=A0AAN9ATJ9_9CAEN
MGVWRCALWSLLLVAVLLQQVRDVTCVRYDRQQHLQQYGPQLNALIRLLDDLEHKRDTLAVDYSDEDAGRQWMEQANEVSREWRHTSAVLEYDFITNITDHNQQRMLENSKKFSEWSKSSLTEGRKFRYHHFRSRDLRRQFRLYTQSLLEENSRRAAEVDEIQSMMEKKYNTATVCMTDAARQLQGNHGNTKCVPLEPDLQDLMAQSRDPEVLKEAWLGWREAAAGGQKQRYARFVSLLNQEAVENGYPDFGEAWRQEQFLDNTDVIKMTSDLWEELRPLYMQIHAYVRRKLRERYGTEVVGSDGAIPAHLLGNMWAQEWRNIYPLVTPYPQESQSTQDFDDLLKEKYDVKGLFNLAEQFYASMGLFNMTDSFWERSMFVKPADREVQCHPSAMDLLKRDDFRIKMCTEVNKEYLQTVHHEMGHVEYFMAYQHQPTVYRDSANCAFHEAIGDTIALSVLSKTHLQSLGLYRPGGGDEERETINELMNIALNKVTFFPFGLTVDRWRWGVFSNVTTPDTYNRDWWKLRLDLQGVRSPVPRSEEDFDPVAKFHVASNTPYICYFVCHVVQFQFLKALCDASGHKGPLQLCDFGGSHAAGTLFKRFMAAGVSRPWQDILEEFTGSREISAQPILEYFRPLHDWLKADNELHQEPLGWSQATVNWRQD